MQLPFGDFPKPVFLLMPESEVWELSFGTRRAHTSHIKINGCLIMMMFSRGVKHAILDQPVRRANLEGVHDFQGRLESVMLLPSRDV